MFEINYQIKNINDNLKENTLTALTRISSLSLSLCWTMVMAVTPTLDAPYALSGQPFSLCLPAFANLNIVIKVFRISFMLTLFSKYKIQKFS